MMKLMKRHRNLSTLPLLAGLLLAGVTAGCSSSEKSETAEERAAESKIVSDADVTKGFAAMPGQIDAAITALGTKDASAKVEAVFTAWASFEGTVKQKEAASYLAIEDALGAFKKAVDGKNATAASAAKAELKTLADEYLAKHP